MAEPFLGMKDILLGYDLDIYFENGDLMYTTGVDYIEREIMKLLLSYKGDWKITPQLGCNPQKFIGEHNTREVATQLESYLSIGLIDTVSPAQIQVKVVPTDYERVMCFIDVFSLEKNFLSIPFDFDYQTGNVKFNRADPKTTQIQNTKNIKNNDIAHMKRPNKYWARIREQ